MTADKGLHLYTWPILVRALLGLLTIGQLVATIWLLVVFYRVFVEGDTLSNPIGLLSTTVFVGLGLMILYSIDLIYSDRMSQNTKILWILVVYLGAGATILPIYWFLYVWRTVVEHG